MKKTCNAILYCCPFMPKSASRPWMRACGRVCQYDRLVFHLENATDIANVDTVKESDHEQDGQDGQNVKIAFPQDYLLHLGINWLQGLHRAAAFDGRLFGHDVFLEWNLHRAGFSRCCEDKLGNFGSRGLQSTEVNAWIMNVEDWRHRVVR